MKGSYQHIYVRFAFFILFSGGSFIHAQPGKTIHSFVGLNFSVAKNSDPNQVLKQLNNLGYPFAQIELDSINPSQTEFTWNVALGNLVTLDTIIASGNLFNKKTLQRCINYQLGDLYSIDKIEGINASLNQISFLKPNTNIQVRLHSETFSLLLKPERKKNNLLSALVALQPKPGTNQSMLTGNFDLELSNALKQAEVIEFHWKRPQPKSQSLAFKLGSPYTAGLPIGFQFEFSSFLRDSTFSSTDLSLRLLTKMNDLNGFSAAINKSTNTHFNTNSTYGNTQVKTYSLRYSKFNSTENAINFYVEGNAGNRTILYESNSTKKKLYTLKGKIYSQRKLGKLFYSNINIEVNAMFSDSLFNNEIARLGGTKNLRGFIEESIYASQYALANCDVGIDLGADIQSFLFADFARVNLPIQKSYYDAGIGFRFQQDNGAVSLTYGVGNIENSRLQIKNGRVGITFTSRF